jgi:hypothetical protein
LDIQTGCRDGSLPLGSPGDQPGDRPDGGPRLWWRTCTTSFSDYHSFGNQNADGHGHITSFGNQNADGHGHITSFGNQNADGHGHITSFGNQNADSHGYLDNLSIAGQLDIRRAGGPRAATRRTVPIWRHQLGLWPVVALGAVGQVPYQEHLVHRGRNQRVTHSDATGAARSPG